MKDYNILTIMNIFQAVIQYHQWSTMSAQEVQQLQRDLTEIEKGLTISDSTQHLRTELTNLRNKVIFQILCYNKVSIIGFSSFI